MNDLIEQYYEQFGEDFPLMRFLGVPEEEITKKIKRCIDDNAPYDPDAEENLPKDAIL